MKHVVLILLILMAGCSPSKEEQAIADYEQVVKLDIIELERLGALKSNDSVPILAKMLDSLSYKKKTDLLKQMDRQLNLVSNQSYRVLLAKNKAREAEARDILELYQSIYENQKKNLSLYERKIYDSTDLKSVNERLALYTEKPDSILAEKFKCVYADGNKKVTKVYHIRDNKVVYAGK
jgi:hypothetical protein